MNNTFDQFDRRIIQFLRSSAIPILRYALGIVFLWFGALKLAGISPVAQLVGDAYAFLPKQEFLIVLGAWEVLVGLGLIFKISLRATLMLFWLQMAGTLFSVVLLPHLFFVGKNPFHLTFEGEFLVKNFVLIAASMVIGGHELVERKTQS